MSLQTPSREKKVTVIDESPKSKYNLLQAPELNFFLSLLPEIKKMSLEQQHMFKMLTLQNIGQILYWSKQK